MLSEVKVCFLLAELPVSGNSTTQKLYVRGKQIRRKTCFGANSGESSSGALKKPNCVGGINSSHAQLFASTVILRPTYTYMHTHSDSYIYMGARSSL